LKEGLVLIGALAKPMSAGKPMGAGKCRSSRSILWLLAL
jgi:hypothetical protein